MDQKKCETSKKYKKDDIIALAKKCNVETTGTRAEICARIAQSVLSGSFPVTNPGIPVKPKTCSLNKTTTAAELMKYSKDDLLKMCAERSMVCAKSWTKMQIATALSACKPLNVEPVCLIGETLPSTPELESKPKKLLQEMCDAKGIKYAESWNKNKLAKALRACECRKPSDTVSVDSDASDLSDADVDADVDADADADSLCYGGKTYEELKEMKNPELSALFGKGKGQLDIKGRPTKKEEMIGYLCASKQNDRCKAPNWECKDDLVCDASNQPEDGVCISRELADKRGFEQITLSNGKRIIGNPTAIKKLKESFKTQPVARLSSPREPTNYTDCYGDYTYEKLEKMTVPQILKEFFGPGKLELKGRPSTKAELIAYLCSIGNERRCTDPDWNCEDGYICDASNDPGVCIPEQFGEDKYLDKRKFDSMMFNGKKIIGTKTSISNLKKKLANADNTPQDDTPAPREPSTQKPKYTDCYGDYTYETLQKMSLSKIVEKFFGPGKIELIDGLDTKEELINYLCTIDPYTYLPRGEPIPTRKASPQRQQPSPNTDCYGDYTYKKLNEMTTVQILKKFFGPGKIELIDGLDTKEELINYLCTIDPYTYLPRGEPIPTRKASPQKLKYTDCYGDYTYEKLEKMTVPQILKEFFGPGKLELKGRPSTRAELIAYLCSIGQDRKCTDPDWNCEDGYICDASNDPGVCIPEQFGEDKYLDKRKFDSMMFNGKKIIGTKTSISNLKKKLLNAEPIPPPREPTPRQQSSPKPPFIEETPKNLDEYPYMFGLLLLGYNRKNGKKISDEELVQYITPIFEKIQSKTLTLEDIKILLPYDKRISRNAIFKEVYLEYLKDLNRFSCQATDWCQDGLSCDVTNGYPGTCIPDSDISRRNLVEISLDGKKIVGSQNAIQEFKKQFNLSEPTPMQPREPTPRQPIPREPTPRQPSPVRQPIPREPTPRQPSPVRQPIPREPTPRQPSPREPTPSKPTPRQPSPVRQPIPREPTPRQPSPVRQPIPREPTPRQPSPVRQPSPREPTPRQPSPVRQPIPGQPSSVRKSTPVFSETPPFPYMTARTPNREPPTTPNIFIQPSPVPREPTPRQPTPREPTPRQPSPVPRQPSPVRQPIPREPTPRQPSPVRQPSPREPTPRQPSSVRNSTPVFSETPPLPYMTARTPNREPPTTPNIFIQPSPVPREPTPRQPTPREPTPRQPTPRQPTPRQPTPREPTPRQPTPRQPTPRQPSPVPREPTPREPSPVPREPTPRQPRPVPRETPETPETYGTPPEIDDDKIPTPFMRPGTPDEPFPTTPSVEDDSEEESDSDVDTDEDVHRRLSKLTSQKPAHITKITEMQDSVLKCLMEM
jgi:hypothetical protein